MTLFRCDENAVRSKVVPVRLNRRNKMYLSRIFVSIPDVIQGSFGLNLRIILEGTNSAAIFRNVDFQESQAESVSGSCSTLLQSALDSAAFKAFRSSLL